MEKQTSSEHPLDIVPFWMKISLVALCLFFAIIGIWRHGLKSWDWVTFVVLLGIFSFPAGVTEPLGRNRGWPLRAIFVLWVIACSAWAVHFSGWVPALAFVGITLLSLSKKKLVGWKEYLQKPLNAIGALLTLILIIWFAQDTGVWVPTAYVVLSFPLLEGYTTVRRSLRANFKRRSFAALAAIAMFAAIWASLHPSFGNVAGLVIVVVLVSSDIYLHTEEAPSLSNISQSRS